MKFLHEYEKHSDGTKYDNGYWKIVGNLLVNRRGGHHIYRPSPDDEIIEADDWSGLPWADILLVPDSITGWISPDGKFYGCNQYDHAEVAVWVLQASERELERKGWVKIYRTPPVRGVDVPEDIRYGWFGEHERLTSPQRKVLESKGFVLVEPGISYWSSKMTDAALAGGAE